MKLSKLKKQPTTPEAKTQIQNLFDNKKFIQADERIYNENLVSDTNATLQELLLENVNKCSPVEVTRILLKHGASPYKLTSIQISQAHSMTTQAMPLAQNIITDTQYEKCTEDQHTNNLNTLALFQRRQAAFIATPFAGFLYAGIFGTGAGFGIDAILKSDFDMFGSMNPETAKILACTFTAIVATALFIGATYGTYKALMPSFKVTDPVSTTTGITTVGNYQDL